MRMFARILVLVPHADDGELGCGGTLAKMSSEGSRIYYAAFSRAARSLLEHGYRPDALEKELMSAAAVLSSDQTGPADAIDVRMFDYEVRTFSYHRQEILDDMIKLRQEIKPDLVLLPSLHDMHQDHGVIAAEGLRAFKHATILAYEQPWNNASFSAAAFIRLTEEQVRKKIDALARYATQREKDYFSADFIRGLARVRGVQAGAEYAEAFEVVRWLIDQL